MTGRWNLRAARAARVALLGLLAGIWLGVLGRAVMAALAMVGGSRPRLSLGGSFEVVAFGVLIGLPATIVFVVLRRWVPGPPVLHGALVGLALFALLVALPPPAARSAASGSPQEVRLAAVPLFGLAFLLYGLTLGWLGSRLADCARRRPVGSR